jgi:hypothetical protein
MTHNIFDTLPHEVIEKIAVDSELTSIASFCMTCKCANTLCHEIVNAKAIEQVNQSLRHIIYTMKIFNDIFKSDSTMLNLLAMQLAEAMFKCFEESEYPSILEFEFINYMHKSTGCPKEFVVKLCKLIVNNPIFPLTLYPRVWESMQSYILGELQSYSVEYHIPLGDEKTQYKLYVCVTFESVPQCAMLLEDTYCGKSFQDSRVQEFIRTQMPDVDIYDDGFGFIRFDITDVNIRKIAEAICQHFDKGLFMSKELLVPHFRIARQFRTLRNWIPTEEMSFYTEIMNTYIDHVEIEEKLVAPLR